MRVRGTALVFRYGKVLLVRDRGKRKFSLPGGASKKKEPSLATAIRELYEELGMSANKAERAFRCDHYGSVNKHKVCIIDTSDEPRLQLRELEEFIWWDFKSDLPRYAHVDQILKKVLSGTEPPPKGGWGKITLPGMQSS